jgi:hypothetical protein
MGRIDVVLPDDIEEKLRKEITKKSGYKKGALSSAVREAIENWLNDKK